MILPAVVFHGIVAIVIILLIVAIIIAGAYTLLRATGRGVNRAAEAGSRRELKR